MGQTRYYNLAYFDFGDDLSNPLNVEKEINRFIVIDKQLYGMYRVFGNGVIDGWIVSDAGNQTSRGITVSVEEGIGVINYLAAETKVPNYIYNLPPNRINNIYARISGTSYLDRSVEFIYSDVFFNSDNYIRIAQVGTGDDDISFINNNIRQKIGFEEIIQEAVDSHQHTGTPSKIDLQDEVKNQLSGARLTKIDVDKITNGKFSLDRIPTIDHNDLENNGLLTHPSLDSFVKTLSQSNKELLGEISSVNLMKSIIFWKYKDSKVDEHFINELAIIPGISPNSFIDFNSSTANIDLNTNCISGIPAKSGIFTSVLWNDNNTFNTNISNKNILIQNDTVSLERSSESIDIIDDFSNGINSFNPETRIINNNTSSSVIVNEGNRIGQLGGGASLRYYYRKNFDQNNWKNWDGLYDELVIKVKTTEQIHEPVYMYLVNGSNINDSGQYGTVEDNDINGQKHPLSSWVILERDEYMTSLQEKVFSISGASLDQVSQIVIYTNDDFIFEIDDIYVRRTNLFSDNGNISFRYSSEAQIIFYSIFYEVDVPEGTDVSIRIKTSGSSDGLSRSSFSYPLSSGDVFALEGRSSEIEVIMASDSSKTLTPVLRSLELRLQTSADFTGFVIDEESEWNEGDLNNISVNDSSDEGKSILNISSPINVGGKFFSKSSSVSEINDLNVGVYGFSGNNMPVSPNQARVWSSSSNIGFGTVSSVERKYNKNFIISDLENNRVLEIDNLGNLVRGFGSSYSVDDSFYPLSAVYNENLSRLTIVFTKPVVVNDISGISLFSGSSSFSLTSDDSIINSNKSGGKILEILLSDNSLDNLVNIGNDLYVDFGINAFTEQIEVNSGLMTPGNSIYSALRGLRCFVGNFVYVDGVKHPVCSKELNSGNWMVLNSSILYGDYNGDEYDFDDVSDMVEFNPDDIDNSIDLFNSTSIKFSDYTLGGFYEYSANKLLVAGLLEDSSFLSSVTGEDLISSLGGENDASEDVLLRASAIDALSGYRGVLVVIDKESNRTQIFYYSPDYLYPSEIDDYQDGTFIISESSFYDISGRVSKINSLGNIVWVYGMGSFARINDVSVSGDDNLIISV